MDDGAEERDHIDKFIEEIKDELPPELDLGVEGAVERIMGLSRRLNKMMEETLAERDLTWGEFKLLGLPRPPGLPLPASPGQARRAPRALERGDDQPARPAGGGGLHQADPRPGRPARRQGRADPGRSEDLPPVHGGPGAKEALIASALYGGERDQLNVLLRRVMIAFEEKAGKR